MNYTDFIRIELKRVWSHSKGTTLDDMAAILGPIIDDLKEEIEYLKREIRLLNTFKHETRSKNDVA